MSQPGFAEQVAMLNTTLLALEARVSSGEIPAEALADFKSSVDDLRLRLWGLVSAGSANDYRGFQERFRLRRAKEICLGLESDLRGGVISERHEELAPLGLAARDLARTVSSMAR
jgi:hypothetical protein